MGNPMIFYKKIFGGSYLQWITLLSILLVSNCLHAEMAHGVGEYFYGPDTSESKACELAQEKAKSVPLISVMGESVSREEQLFCKEETSGKKSNYECEYNSVKWSLIDGDFKSPINVKRELDSKTGFKSCKVSLDVEVIVPLRKSDPNFDVKAKIFDIKCGGKCDVKEKNFDLKAKTNQTVFRVGDDLLLEVQSTMPAYFAVFNWLPHENNQVNFVPITPYSEYTVIDSYDSYVLKKDAGGKFIFNEIFSATWSKAYKGDKKFYYEWIIVAVTKKSYKWLSSYDLDDFKTKIWQIPNDERRIVRRGYLLSK